MCRFVSISYGRSGEDELGWFLPAVAGNADGVPKGGSILPFINQARSFSFQKQGSLRQSCGKVFIPFVGILQFDNACRLLFRSCRLSAPFGAFYIDRAEGIEVILQLVVNRTLTNLSVKIGGKICGKSTVTFAVNNCIEFFVINVRIIICYRMLLEPFTHCLHPF